MSVNDMRIAVGKAYPGKNWIKKVMAMSDEQVIAVYKSFVESGKIRV